jgi:hypothetical protein
VARAVSGSSSDRRRTSVESLSNRHRTGLYTAIAGVQPSAVSSVSGSGLEDAALEALARRFVGRAGERASLGRWLEEARAEPRIVWLSGPAGIGKSALAHVFGRDARAAGHRVFFGEPVPGDLGRAARADAVVLEATEPSAALAALTRLRAGSGAALLVLVASRVTVPDALRAQPHLEAVTRALQLRPLAPEEAEAVLVGRGVAGAEAARLAPLAAGSPQALVELAERARADRLTPLAQRAPTELDDALADAVHRAASDALERSAIDALGVAGTLDVPRLARMLALPERSEDGRDAVTLLAWLARQSFVAREAGAVTCLPTMRKALVHHLRARDPSLAARLQARLDPTASASPAPSVASPAGLGPAAEPQVALPGELGLALRDALAARHRPHLLRASPLASLACVRALSGPPERALAEVLDEVCRELAASPGYASAGRLLEVTYLDPATVKQEAAAAALGLAFGTYRYQLRRALELATEALATREARASGRSPP